MTSQPQPQSDMASGMVSQAQAELVRVQQAYRDWQMRQRENMANMEMRLTQRRADIADEITLRAGALATAIAEEQLKVERYAQAVQQAITGTDNPYAYAGSGNPYQPQESPAGTPPATLVNTQPNTPLQLPSG